MEAPLPSLRRATESDWDIIIQLIDGAAEWLQTKNTDQWRQPWPSAEDRKHRILRDLRAGRTWIDRMAATEAHLSQPNRRFPEFLCRQPDRQQ